MTLMNLTPSLGATMTWLTEGARSASAPEDVLHQLCSQLRAAGLAIDRCAVFIRTLHPNVMGRRFLWTHGDGVQVNEAEYEVLERESYQRSPISAVQRTGKAIRLHLEQPDCPTDFNIVDDFRIEGFTDYLAHPLDFLNGQHHVISWSTKRAGGFRDEDILALMAVRDPLARIAEIYALRHTAAILLDTYVGHRTGQLILEGKIRRGNIQKINAAILMADLRGFTAISNHRSPEDVVGLLNAYYDCLAPSIEESGGEILKFIGDGLLAIFPIGQDPEGVCDAALHAAEEGQRRLLERDGDDLRCGMALHRGDVRYGNIGSMSRLDFTAIGPAINLAARMERLTSNLDCRIITSAAFAEACTASLKDLGSFALRGFDEPFDMFAPIPSFKT